MLEWLVGWYNWPFLFLLGVTFIFILMEALLSGVGALQHGHGLDHDHDMSHDGGHDGDHGLDHDGGGHDHDHSSTGLSWLGVGKVPISIVFEMLFSVFGVTGLMVNALWSEVLPWVPWVSLPVALIVGLLVALPATAWFTDKLAKYMPADSTISRKPGGFRGEAGVVTRTVTLTGGEVRVRGVGVVPASYLNCKRNPVLTPGDIPCGKQVVVVEYLEATNSYTVAPMEEM